MAVSQPPYIKDDQGSTFIAASQRPDGTWRKPRRVREGYVPQDEVPLYESKGRQFSKSKPEYPVGLPIEVINESKARHAKKKEKAVNSPIPGLVLESPPDGKSGKKKKKKKGSCSPTSDNISDTLSRTHLFPAEPESGEEAASPTYGVWKTVPSSSKTSKATSPGMKPSSHETEVGGAVLDPAKRIKNLRKRLREIEGIEQKMMSGELKSLEKDQIEKVGRKQEILRDIELLAEILGEE
uniref:Partner of Y14 and mago n=2 Tax=Timema TaxID=61471 RepID=A0A7R9EH10_9NEOP|nr:unnamed protein product [Timema cristinae]CAD7432902.1 unnamed protein product [Timema monikensis]